MNLFSQFTENKIQKCENAKILNTPQKWKNVNVNCIMHYAYATKQPRKKQK